MPSRLQRPTTIWGVQPSQGFSLKSFHILSVNFRRFAAFTAMRCRAMPWAFLCRHPFLPLFRSSSREMVETEQPIRAAMYVSDLPSFFSVQIMIRFSLVRR